MRVIINGIAALERKTGVGHYIDSLHRALSELPGNDHFDLYPPDGLTRRAMKFARDRIVAAGKATSAGSSKPLAVPAFPRLPTASRQLARQVARFASRKHFALRCQRRGCDLYHEPNYLPWVVDLPTVVTVLDLSVLRFPHWHPADRVEAFEKHFYRGLNRAEHLITISEFTREEMIRYLGIAPHKVTSIHIGMREGFFPTTAEEREPILRKLNLSEGYFLHVGTLEPRKNLILLMRAWEGLPENLRRKHPLVLVGGKGWRSEPIMEWLENRGKPAGVIHIGYVPEGALTSLLGGALALAYPSLYEGFGLPPLEMMACGGAVLTSDIGALREVMPSGTMFLSPEDPDAWRNAMLQLIQDPELVRHLRAGAVEFAGRYTWKKCAEETREVYRRAVVG